MEKIKAGLQETQTSTKPEFWEDLSNLKLVKKRKKEHSDRFIPKKVEANLYNILKTMDPSPKNLAPISIKMEKSSSLNGELRKNESLKNFQLRLGELVLPERSSSSKKKKFRRFLKYSDWKEKPMFEESEFIEFFSPKNDPNPKIRKIECSPYKVLDAPGMEDDFYSQPLEWTKGDKIVISLNKCVFRWCPKTQKNGLVFKAKHKVTAISSNFDSMMAIGTETGGISLTKVESEKNSKFSLKGHKDRCAAMDFNFNTLASGSRSSEIFINDLRCPQKTPILLQGHIGEICGLSFSPNGNYLASGDSSNRLSVWDLRMNSKIFSSNQHSSSIRALAWNPRSSSELASGGGSKDKSIKIWNINTKEILKDIYCGSQVTSLIYSKSSEELLSAHGFSDNSLAVWDTKNYEKIANLTGHTSRVLHVSLSPDCDKIVSAAGDQTLRFWNVFPKMRQVFSEKNQDLGFLGLSTIR